MAKLSICPGHTFCLEQTDSLIGQCSAENRTCMMSAYTNLYIGMMTFCILFQ